MSHREPCPSPSGRNDAFRAPVATTVVQTAPGIVTVRVSGDVDLATRPRLEATVHRVLIARPWHVTIDMTGTSFCSLAALNALLELHRAAEEAGSELDIRPSSALSHLLEITESADVLPTASR